MLFLDCVLSSNPNILMMQPKALQREVGLNRWCLTKQEGPEICWDADKMLVFFKLMHSILYFEEEFSQISSKYKVADEKTHLNKIVGTPILKLAMDKNLKYTQSKKIVRKNRQKICHRNLKKPQGTSMLKVISFLA